MTIRHASKTITPLDEVYHHIEPRTEEKFLPQIFYHPKCGEIGWLRCWTFLAFILIPTVSMTMFGDFNYLSITDLDEILGAHVLGHGFLFSTFSCQILETVRAEAF